MLDLEIKANRNCLNQDFQDERINRIGIIQSDKLTHKIIGCAMKVHRFI
ncbi:hypothetical protein R83H12_01250 [Fibrobacteria bacterium R8-3-H12]